MVIIVAISLVVVVVVGLFMLLGCKDHVLDEWVRSDTSISYHEKREFVNALSLVGGIVGMHHPRFKDMQEDYLDWRKSHEHIAEG